MLKWRQQIKSHFITQCRMKRRLSNNFTACICPWSLKRHYVIGGLLRDRARVGSKSVAAPRCRGCAGLSWEARPHLTAKWQQKRRSRWETTARRLKPATFSGCQVCRIHGAACDAVRSNSSLTLHEEYSGQPPRVFAMWHDQFIFFSAHVVLSLQSTIYSD